MAAGRPACRTRMVSPIGLNRPIVVVIWTPRVGVPEADGAESAVRDGGPGDVTQALFHEVLNGENLAVDIYHVPERIASLERKGPLRGLASDQLIRGIVPESHLNLPGEQPPEDEVRHRDLGGLLAPHDGDDGDDDSDDSDGDDGGHFWPFLLIPAELLLASCASTVHF